MIATMIITLAIMARRLISDARIINITNALNSKKILIVHCKAQDHDVGAGAMSSGEVYSWSFEDVRGVPRGPYWCRLALDDKRLHFLAYLESGYGVGYAVTGYQANETGVYGPDDEHNQWKQIDQFH
ncbi:unnamed protein product [Linum trigynum]